jgi:hypothetical protein
MDEATDRRAVATVPVSAMGSTLGWLGLGPMPASVFRAVCLGSLVLLHVPLALAMDRYPNFATIHAVAVLGIGLVWALSGRHPQRVACTAAYIAGAEVLWRMTEARVFWGFSKYAIAALLGLALLRSLHRWLPSRLPATYFMLLLPSVWLTVDSLGLSEAARRAISNNLSAPLALAVAALFFAQRPFSWPQVFSVAWSAIAPILGIATLAVRSTLTADNLRFVAASNNITSGDYDPNKVSILLGLGGMLGVLLALEERKLGLRILAAFLALLFLAQGLLTLSRGGVYSEAIGLTLAAVNYARRRRLLIGRPLTVLVIALAAGSFTIVQLNAFTQGALVERFGDLATSGRIEIARADLQIWKENWLLGVGPGVSNDHRSQILSKFRIGHTEYTRLLAEHGILGLLAIVTLLAMLWRAYQRACSPEAKAWVIALAGWSLATMAHLGMFTAAPSFALALIMIQWPRRCSRQASTVALGQV